MAGSITFTGKCVNTRIRCFHRTNTAACIASQLPITVVDPIPHRRNGLRLLSTWKMRMSHKTCEKPFTWQCGPRGRYADTGAPHSYERSCAVPRGTRWTWEIKQVKGESNA